MLIRHSSKPFWICDTDIVFFKKMEADFSGQDVFAGRLEPKFGDLWTNTTHAERLHTCLMWIDPVSVRLKIREWAGRLPPPWSWSIQHPMILQHAIPVRGGKTMFLDTTCGLWQAGCGKAFSEDQNSCFEHLYAATYVDCVGNNLGFDIAAAHRAIYKDTEMARGIRSKQDDFYAAMSGCVESHIALREKIGADESVRLSHHNRNRLLPIIKSLNGCDGLEIGAWKGESTAWFMENGMATMTVVDKLIQPEFYANTAKWNGAVKAFQGDSVDVLRKLIVECERFDFIYVDGSHKACDVLMDAISALDLVNPGGYIVFDDYEFLDNTENPKYAIDLFLRAYPADLEVISKGAQVVVRKPSAGATLDLREKENAYA
jgi:predicted O-methyltransferase YrrM